MIADVFLASSLSVKILWVVCERLLGLASYELLSTEELFSSIGFAVACLICSSEIPVCGFFFKEVDVSFNYYAVGCYAGRLILKPLCDCVWFSGFTVFERWQVLTMVRHGTLKLVLLAVMGLEVAFFILSGYAAFNHDEWYFAIPAYGLFGFLWISLHIVFFVTCWKFINKFDKCNELYRQSNQDTHETLGVIMASRGMRFFTLVARRLVLSTLFSSLFLGAVTWQDHNAEFLGAWLAVIPLEVMVHGLLCELGNTLGGTCTGLALVGPSSFCR
ncbi:putative transmembrane protein [Apostichopus japonicus]|uniref:Transmembrane protein 168 n=1 Tax=Stichopus japonicus TaxID=307972 RepID=A0A2G8LR56_STIJA|nr:putative transmembrane protein [Apostichopus japonicus]